MNRKNYKVKILLINDETDEPDKWGTLYLDMNNVMGFRIDEEEDAFDGSTIIYIYLPGESFAVKSEPHVREVLLDMFVNDAIESL